MPTIKIDVLECECIVDRREPECGRHSLESMHFQRIHAEEQEISAFFREMYLDSQSEAPSEIILDLACYRPV